jgi:hypothetical protein
VIIHLPNDSLNVVVFSSSFSLFLVLPSHAEDSMNLEGGGGSVMVVPTGRQPTIQTTLTVAMGDFQMGGLKDHNGPFKL